MKRFAWLLSIVFYSIVLAEGENCPGEKLITIDKIAHDLITTNYAVPEDVSISMCGAAQMGLSSTDGSGWGFSLIAQIEEQAKTIMKENGLPVTPQEYFESHYAYITCEGDELEGTPDGGLVKMIVASGKTELFDQMFKPENNLKYNFDLKDSEGESAYDFIVKSLSSTDLLDTERKYLEAFKNKIEKYRKLL